MLLLFQAQGVDGVAAAVLVAGQAVVLVHPGRLVPVLRALVHQAQARQVLVALVLDKVVRARVAAHELAIVVQGNLKEPADESFTAIYSAAGGHLASDGGHFACGRSCV